MEQTINNIILIVLVSIFVVAPIFRIHASVVLWRAYKLAKARDLPTGPLIERFFIAATGSVSVIILGGLGLLRVIWGIVLPFPVGPTLTALAMILLVLPSFVWEWMYLTGRLER